MYRRRLQKMGAASLGVSLPKKWLRYHGLKRGDEVEVEVAEDYTLIVRPSTTRKPVQQSCFTVDYEGIGFNEAFLKLVSLYVNGVDLIRVKCGLKCSEFRERVYRVLESSLIGLEVIEEGEGYITFACLVDVASLPLIEAVRKMSRALPLFIREVEESIRSRLALDVEERDGLIDKLYLYSIRQLNMVMQGRLPLDKTGLKSLSEALSIASTLKTLERIGDHIVQLYYWSRGRSAGELKSVEGFMERIREAMINILSEYTSILEDPGRPLSVEESILKLRSLEEELKSRDIDASAVVHLMRIIAYLTDIVEAAMDIVVSRSVRSSKCGD